jgi:hypothetical protein
VGGYFHIPGEQVGDAFSCMVGHTGDDPAEIIFRVKAIEPRRLCRKANYAEQARFPQLLS